MEEQQQLVGARRGRLVQLGPGLGVLRRVARAGGRAPVDADTVPVGEVVRPPGGVLVAVDTRSVVVARLDHEADAERRGVLLVGAPRAVQHRSQPGRQLLGSRRKRERDPLVQDPARVGIRVPGEPAEGVEVRLRQRMPGPERVVTDVGDRHQPALRQLQDSGLLFTLRLKAQRLAPHRSQPAHVPLLPGVLLRGLHLHRDPCARQRSQHRRDRLTHLEVHRPVLHLEHDVLGELPVQRREMVVRGPRPVRRTVPPVLAVVVHERPPMDGAAVRSESRGQHVRAVRV